MYIKYSFKVLFLEKLTKEKKDNFIYYIYLTQNVTIGKKVNDFTVCDNMNWCKGERYMYEL